MNENMSYLDWLRWLIGRSGIELPVGEAVELFNKKFEPVIKYDENRAVDGKVLRHVYEEETGQTCSLGENEPCTMLEMMIALARHMFDTMDGWIPDNFNTVGRWFHEMLDNMAGPRKRSKWDSHRWDDALEQILNRTYSETGEGGFFPRQNCTEDQRTVELWNQMQGYLLEYYS